MKIYILKFFDDNPKESVIYPPKTRKCKDFDGPNNFISYIINCPYSGIIYY